jgi:hypothetical protein
MYKQSKVGIWKIDLTVNNLRKPLVVVIHRNNNRFKKKSLPLSAFIDISRSAVI